MTGNEIPAATEDLRQQHFGPSAGPQRTRSGRSGSNSPKTIMGAYGIRTPSGGGSPSPPVPRGRSIQNASNSGAEVRSKTTNPGMSLPLVDSSQEAKRALTPDGPLAKAPKCYDAANDMSVDTGLDASNDVVARFQSNLRGVVASASPLYTTSGGGAVGQGATAWTTGTSQDYNGAQQLHFNRIEIGAIGMQAQEAERLVGAATGAVTLSFQQLHEQQAAAHSHQTQQLQRLAELKL